MKKVIKFWRKMRESVCALQEGIYTNEASLFEMASQILSSVFLIFFSLPPPRHRPEREDLDFGTTVVWDPHPRRLANSSQTTT